MSCTRPLRYLSPSGDVLSRRSALYPTRPLTCAGRKPVSRVVPFTQGCTPPAPYVCRQEACEQGSPFHTPRAVPYQPLTCAGRKPVSRVARAEEHMHALVMVLLKETPLAFSRVRPGR